MVKYKDIIKYYEWRANAMKLDEFNTKGILKSHLLMEAK